MRGRGIWTGVSHVALMAGMAWAVSGGVDSKADAEEAPQLAQTNTVEPTDGVVTSEDAAADEGGDAGPGEAVVLETIEVEGGNPPNTLQHNSSVDRLPGTVQDQPQAINVISEELMLEQGVETLEEALRNVPGVTVSIGEGRGGMNGDQFRIRGLPANNDVYTDGLRDFGVFTRDSFNYESIQVLKGPSSGAFGMGTTGGAINTSTKSPSLENRVAGSVGFGTDSYYRMTGDVNQTIGETSAIRLNAMFHNADTPDRDFVQSMRFGVAPSIGFGLGTETELTISYLFQHDDRVPDYGVPVVAPTSANGEPVTEFGVDRSTWYGNDTDSDESDVHMLTARFRYEATDWLTVHNDTRLGYYDRYFTPTPASCNAACATALFDGDPSTVPTVSRGGPGPFEQETYGAQNITTAIAEFSTGVFEHQAVGGVDIFYQHDERDSYAYSPSRPATDLFDPDPSSPYSIVPSTSTSAHRVTEALNYGLFASDRIWFLPELSVIGGVRVDWYDVDYTTSGPSTPATTLETRSTQFNYKASVVWEPTEMQSYYISYATSSNPPGASIAQAPTPLNADDTSLDPETHEIYEVGAKVNLFDNRLGLTGSLFQINKNNATYIDDTNTVVTSGDEQRIRGIEIGATGQITDYWAITANYTYLDAETTGSDDPTVIGNRVQYVPKNAAALWTTLDVSALIDTGPGDFTIGGGATYRDSVYLNDDNNRTVPYNLSFDAMASYAMDNYTVQVNAYNLADRLNYDQVFGNRAIPSAGRSVILTVSAEF